MNYLAMDISKKEIVFFADQTKQIFKVINSFEAVRTFLIQEEFDSKNTMIGCESTGDYHLQVCLVALEMGFKVKVLNPILTKQVINATIRKKKTDQSDAEIIAKLLRDGLGQEVSKEDLIQEKKVVLRTERRITECASDLKRVKKSLEEKSKSMDVSIALQAIEECIIKLKQEADQLTKQATKEQTRQEEIIDSIPGCGEKLSAIISAEAGDITRFPSSSQLKAYVGIDPKVSQSGQSSYTGKMTKRGNSNLRYALFLAASVARQHDPELKAFYDKKRSEGKSYRHAVCAVSRKLCERIYAIVSKNCLYEVRKSS